MTMTYLHYAFLGLAAVAALTFAFLGKMPVDAAFGIVGTAAGITLPTATKAPVAPAA